MIVDIQAISTAHDYARPPAAEAESDSGVGSFGSLLSGLMERASEAEREADDVVHSLARGEPVDVHRVVTAVTEADLSFRMLLEVRNKLIEAWNEIRRMPV